jgi:hypothetical protein
LRKQKKQGITPAITHIPWGKWGLDDAALTEEFNPIFKDFGMETPQIE